MLKLIHFILAVITYFFSGYAFMKLFNWFPSEIFGITTVGYAQALGLMLFYTLIRTKYVTHEEYDVEKAVGRQIAYLIFYGLSLLIGLILMPYV